jgi:hypothetical protein
MGQQVNLYIDVQNRQIVRNPSTTVAASLPDVYQGDTVGLYLEFMNPTGNFTTPYQDIDYSQGTVTVAVGSLAATPSGGYFTLSDSAASQTTGNLPYNATAAQVQTAIQASLTTNWSAATVVGAVGGPYTITNGSSGSKTSLLGSSVSLTPISSVPVSTIQYGTPAVPQIEYAQLVQSPIALQTEWTPYPAPVAVVTRLQSGSTTLNEIQQISLINNPTGGAFVVNFTGASISATSSPIAWNATPSAVQSALQGMPSIGAGNCSVGGAAGQWVATFGGALANSSQNLMTTISTGLVGPLALTGNLALNTAGIEEAMGENNSITETFAVQVTPNLGSPFTALQEDITIYNDLISGAPSVPAPGVSYWTAVQSDARYLQIDPVEGMPHIPSKGKSRKTDSGSFTTVNPPDFFATRFAILASVLVGPIPTPHGMPVAFNTPILTARPKVKRSDIPSTSKKHSSME